MTALKPLENRRVRGVAAERYPLNEKCAHPECSEPSADPHHCFPRSQIGGDSWFVEVWSETGVIGPEGQREVVPEPPIPHVAGLCRAHHDDVEEHRAWIKLEDGEFVWWGRDQRSIDAGKPEDKPLTMWSKVGPLNPQPGSREGKPKRKRFTGQARRERKVISIKVPQDADEDGAGVWDELVSQCREALGVEDDFPVYYTLTKVIYDWLTGGTAAEAKSDV